jgi:glutamine amidotransferase
MSKHVTIVYYGMGNIRSVSKAFEFHGVETTITDDPEAVRRADRLVLPGVGAFKTAMEELTRRHLTEPILEHFEKQKPYLGICLGMQMLFSRSTEFGLTEGFDLIGGEVSKIPNTSESDGTQYKIPNIGWCPLTVPDVHEAGLWDDTILKDIEPGAHFYFVHSYCGHAQDATQEIGHTQYGENRITAVVRKGNAYGCQFHPEKSGPVGLQVIQNFLSL